MFLPAGYAMANTAGNSLLGPRLSYGVVSTRAIVYMVLVLSLDSVEFNSEECAVRHGVGRRFH